MKGGEKRWLQKKLNAVNAVKKIGLTHLEHHPANHVVPR
jgi:hypothetical protein